ncbi:hypothetical protein AJ88_26210 [Mesorhizobium amorphae CCBAU 01583]|nr:hypothetical protein AJ88_26210 [Mesorhizobium amorphae CCBAU 01583]
MLFSIMPSADGFARMSTDAILGRLAALEEQFAEFLPAALERRRNVFEPCDWLMAKTQAKAQIDRDEARMSVVETAEIRIVGDIDDALALSAHDQLEAARLSPAIKCWSTPRAATSPLRFGSIVPSAGTPA